MVVQQVIQTVERPVVLLTLKRTASDVIKRPPYVTGGQRGTAAAGHGTQVNGPRLRAAREKAGELISIPRQADLHLILDRDLPIELNAWTAVTLSEIISHLAGTIVDARVHQVFHHFPEANLHMVLVSVHYSGGTISAKKKVAISLRPW